VTATVTPAEQRVLLHDISWDTYERLLAESIANCGTRFTYSEGELEIMVLSAGHEQPNRILAFIAEITAASTGRDCAFTGSTTFKRKDLAKGFEPDSSFYFRNALAMRELDEIDLASDPPPELVIEVDITRSSLNRLPIFAAVGVSEVWRYDAHGTHFYTLDGKSYREIAKSVVLAPMTATQASFFIDRYRREPFPIWLASIQDWVRAHS
jgi:Uma2 family endonuclease